MPEFHVRFYPYANLNHTIRLRDGVLLVRISDLMEGAPEALLGALAHMLLARLYRRPVDARRAARYRRFSNRRDVADRAYRVRQLRGRKRLASPRGRAFDLEEIFDALNLRFFHGLLGRPQLAWSPALSRSRLGHYDPAHNAIVISRALDSERVPRCAVEYLVFHEMLHLRHPVRRNGPRRVVHPPEFQREERLFPEYALARSYLKRLAENGRHFQNVDARGCFPYTR